MPIIKINNLSKRYIIGHDLNASGIFRYKSLRDSLSHSARALYQRLRHPLSPNRENTDLEEFWALKDVSFEINQGDRVGIIGRNGAGKSTLLKILSRITEPTTGKIQIKGRVASLLEVGTGFHPELSGRENIYLNGAILGMTRAEIKRKFYEIVEFAEVEKFLDTPVKHYSSGMYVRLAFAVAAHLEPEILVVDEVLAVGDILFQKKCIGKMEEVSTREGRTILLVSHNMSMITNLCQRVILLNDGKIIRNDQTREVVQQYLVTSKSTSGEVSWPNLDQAPGGEISRLRSVRILQDGIYGSTADVNISKEIIILIEYLNLQEGSFLHTSIDLMNDMGVFVLSSSSVEIDWQNHPKSSGIFRSICRIPANFLNDGHYHVTVNLVKTTTNTPEAREEDLLMICAHDTGEMQKVYYSGWPGVVRPLLNWSTEYQGTLDKIT